MRILLNYKLYMNNFLFFSLVLVVELFLLKKFIFDKNKSKYQDILEDKIVVKMFILNVVVIYIKDLVEYIADNYISYALFEKDELK